MSACSDWKCGALSDDEYRQESASEARRDEYLTSLEYGCEDDEDDDDLE